MHWREFSPGGIIIALVGFLLTRFTVSLAATESQQQFLWSGVVPLILGLTLSAFGVVLTVGRYDPEMVRTTAVWCLVGTGSMLLLVVLTLLGTEPAALTDVTVLRDQAIFSNFLIGGAIGGTLTGIFAARNRRQRRDVRQQANRLVMLNRLLRDQVINAATAIKGHTEVLKHSQSEQSVDVIDRQAENVINTVENVKYLTNTGVESAGSDTTVDLVDAVETGIDAVETQHPGADCSFHPPEDAVPVYANDQLTEVIRHLVENAVEYGDSDTPRVELNIQTTRRSATVSVSDDGPGLPADQQALLEEGTIAEFDDPSTGFGLNIVRLLVESFDGTIDTEVSNDGTTVSIELPRPGEGATETSHSGSLTTPAVATPNLLLVIGASLAGGLAMGLVMQGLTGFVPVIGALYGVDDRLVGWISHEFHSVVFGLVYAAILSTLPHRYTSDTGRCVAIAVGFSLLLWAVAAGVVMPLWLHLVGLEARLPNLTPASFAGHLAWGVTLGVLYRAHTYWS
jgi:signal transduction histidine kinase